MASVRLEFLDDERELMWELYGILCEKLDPKVPKPPQKNTAGKWHFYMENPAHKQKAKAARQAREDVKQN